MPVLVPDRRSNLLLRALIDDMLDNVRLLNRTAGTLSDADRATAEAQLDQVMAHVRRVAAQGPQGRAAPRA